jgi:hypothetical protein
MAPVKFIPTSPLGVDVVGRFAFNHGLCKLPCVDWLAPKRTVREIEAAIPRFSRAETEELRAWTDDSLEDQLELTDELNAKLDQSRREIAAGKYITRPVVGSCRQF